MPSRGRSQRAVRHPPLPPEQPPNGTLVASGSFGGTIAVVPFDRFAAGAVASVKQPRGGMALGGGVPSLAFHPGRPIVVGGLKDAVLWSVASPRDLKPFGDLSRIGKGIWPLGLRRHLRRERAGHRRGGQHPSRWST